MSSFFDRVFVAGDGMVRLLDEDPELFEALSPQRRLEARAHAVAPAMRLRPGTWDGSLPDNRDPSMHLGLLVLEGAVVRNVHVTRHPRSELVGPGDLARPWEHQGDIATMPFAADWCVLEPTRMAILDARFLVAVCRWPVVVSSILGRAVRRSHGLALQLAISDARHIRERLLLFFWHLADRWGRVGADGVTVPVRLTHEVIAQLVGAQRPTVSTALRALSSEGLVTRRADRTWLLTPAATSEVELDASRRTTGAARSA